MRSLALWVLILFVLAPAAFAMDTSQIAWYAHGDLALPTGSFGDFAGTGFGGGIGGALPFNEALTLRGEAGYVHFGGQEFLGSKWNYSLIPIMALGEYRFTAGSAAYGLGGLGLILERFSYDWVNPWSGAKENLSDSNSDINLAVGGGYHLNEQMTVEARYTTGDLDYMSVHFLYNF